MNNKDTGLVLAYMTAGDEETARIVASALVEDRLAACVNLLPGMRSIYRWQDQTEEASEWVMIAKTRANLADRLIQRVCELHPYDCPCVVILPLSNGNPEFLGWLAEQTNV